MGPGGPLDAAFHLAGPIHAGAWHLVGDGLILNPVDVRFDVVWRGAGGDQTLATFQHHFDPPPPPNQFNAAAFEADAPGIAAAATANDQLILRMTAMNVTAPSYIPNGDGAKTQGRIPSLTLPP